MSAPTFAAAEHAHGPGGCERCRALYEAGRRHGALDALRALAQRLGRDVEGLEANERHAAGESRGLGLPPVLPPRAAS